MKKFLVNGTHTINLANFDEFTISCNYLKLFTGGGLNAREVSFIYGTDENLTKLHKAIMEFIASDLVVFDCKKFMENL